jgi:hypothetical protein
MYALEKSLERTVIHRRIGLGARNQTPDAASFTKRLDRA